MGDDPSWMNRGSEAQGSEQRHSSAAGGVHHVKHAASGDIGPPAPYKTPVKIFCLIMNLGLGLCVALNGMMALGHKTNGSDVGVLFVATYMFIFAVILILFETIQICPCQMVDEPFKKNFGFLYGTLGKCCYLLFIGILAFGVGSYPDWSPLSAFGCIGWGIIQALLYMFKPQWFPKREKYVPDYD